MMTDEDRDKVAKKFIKYRAINNLSQNDLANKLGCSNTTINSIEKRKKSVQEITIETLLMKLGLED